MRKPALAVVADVPAAPTSVLEELVASWTRSLKSGNKSPRTIEVYSDSALQFARFLDERRFPQDPSRITRAHVEEYVNAVMSKSSVATASVRFRSLQQLFRWLLEENEIQVSPVQHMRPPKLKVVPPPVLRDEQLHALFKACEGDDFESRRDTAIMSIFYDCGIRRAEMAGLRYLPNDPIHNDVDLKQEELRVVGKGNKERRVSMSPLTVKALDRYLRLRARYPYAHLPQLWLTRRGPMTSNGVLQMIYRRGEQAGLDHLHPHMFRHSFAQSWLRNGGNEHELMKLAGWSSLAMVSRYADATAAERAREAHKRFSPMEALRAHRTK